MHGRKRIAICYDSSARPDTTGEYCRKALEKSHDVVHFPPDAVAAIDDTFDLYLNIDDGSRYLLPERLRPAAFWAIDTHFHYQWLLHKARRFDYIFAAQKDGAEKFTRDGAQAVWLPLACDERVHRRHDVAKKYDVCFVGNIMPGEKQRLSVLVRKAFGSMFVDGRFVFDPSIMTNLFIGKRKTLLKALSDRFAAVFIGNAFFEEMAITYSASKIVFNRSIKNDINMRVFEALACGSLLVTNNLDRNGLAELFTDRVHYVSYRAKKDLLEKIDFYLAHDEERESIARAGMVEAHQHHTYTDRMNRLLDICFPG